MYSIGILTILKHKRGLHVTETESCANTVQTHCTHYTVVKVLCSQTVHVVKFMCNSVESQELTSTALHLTHADFFGYVTN